MRLPPQGSNDLGFRKNADVLLTGQEIVDAYERGDLEFRWIGRMGGIDGEKLATDITSGRWRTHEYEARRTPMPGNANWFAAQHFIRRLGARTQAVQVEDSADSSASFVPRCRRPDPDGECTKGMSDPRFCGLCAHE